MLPSVLRRYIHLSLVPALIVAAPEVKVSPSALSRVGLTPEIKAAHPAQSSRTSAHQKPKGYFLEASFHLWHFGAHPFIFGTHLRYQNWYFFIRVLSAFYLALEKSGNPIGGGRKSAIAPQTFSAKVGTSGKSIHPRMISAEIIKF